MVEKVGKRRVQPLAGGADDHSDMAGRDCDLFARGRGGAGAIRSWSAVRWSVGTGKHVARRSSGRSREGRGRTGLRSAPWRRGRGGARPRSPIPRARRSAARRRSPDRAFRIRRTCAPCARGRATRRRPAALPSEARRAASPRLRNGATCLRARPSSLRISGEFPRRGDGRDALDFADSAAAIAIVPPRQ